ncbi:endonuclease V [Candidatus Sumerlaeota bacterium]|nr:endonuclease V [Candidatus Sumerlaeota bacterium]
MSALDISRLAEKQRQMARQVILADGFGEIRWVGGCDVSLRRSRRSSEGAATVTVFSFTTIESIEAATVRGRVEFPYVPGFLAFREFPLVARAFARLKTQPDVLILDGHGLAHPRRFGLACYAGLELDIPTIGCAKSLLCGEFEPFELRRGNRSPILLDSETVGFAVCTRDGVKPLFVSLGHKITLETAVEIVLRCAVRYRQPEPTRLAHAQSRRAIGR